jgi:hypothetical protein
MSPRRQSWRTVRILLESAILAIAAASAGADTYTVVNTNDTGAGSLRQAITDANAHGGSNTIVFTIPGSGVHTIDVPTQLPWVTSPVVIDGTTQPGYAGAPLIEIHGEGVAGIYIYAGGSTLRGLVLNGFGTAVLLQSAGGNVIQGCYVGTDATGTVSDSSLGEGIRLISSNGNTIGGTSAGAGNLISGNASAGIGIESSNGTIIQGNLLGIDITGGVALPNGSAITLSGNDTTIGGSAAGARNVISGNIGSAIEISYGSGIVIQGNIIGPDVTGTKALGNGMGINDSGAVNVTIGGSGPGEGNLVSGNNGYGMYLYNGASDTTVFGNLIGTDVTGTLPLPNITGVASSNSNAGLQIGGTGPGEANVIAFNTGYLSYSLPVGVLVYAGSDRIAIRGNSIHDNEGLGIAFTDNMPTPNDPGDVDTGANDKQNFPIIRSIIHGASSTEFVGKFDSAASTTYTLDFYANPTCTRFPRDFDEGETYLGSSPVTTDASGHKEFDITLPVATVDGARITVTATDPLGNTSEFSQRIIFSMNPSSGPAAGGRPLTINGTDFSNPTTITIGGAAVPQTYVNDHQLYTTSPSIDPGKVNDVVVTTSDGTTGTLVNGWVSDFLDVAEGHQFHDFVTTLVSNAITVGVGQGLYGVDQPTLRRQMAVFLLKARHGLCYVPPPCSGTMFLDVPCQGSPFDPWIEALAVEGISGGCGGGNYCPTAPVRRDQMAVFLLKAEHGPSYAPPPCAGIYGDVACPSTFANWIEQLSQEGITGGCGGGNYCPGNANTRGQMAVFIVKTFRLT